MRESMENGQELYSVSETVQKTGVPSHVLRYWEDELHLSIRRSAQGYRIYSAENIATFQKVKELKDKGIQLKAIRMLMENSEEGKRLEMLLEEETTNHLCTASECAGQLENAARLIGDKETSSRLISADIPPEGRGCHPARAESTGELENAARRTGAEETELEYAIIPTSESGNYQRFESMMRSLICEAVAEQNEKLERDLTELIRDEFEDLYIQLRQETARREAAAANMSAASAPAKRGIFQKLVDVIKERQFFY
ncbi:MAG: helix-turn-helix domain-containing protein [Lachnospiraceae bacterium]|nr:helix-turn-helix domain-containing protein [Lachnospiraceae bacterium]